MPLLIDTSQAIALFKHTDHTVLKYKDHFSLG